jgi:hypothetical protein
MSAAETGATDQDADLLGGDGYSASSAPVVPTNYRFDAFIRDLFLANGLFAAVWRRVETPYHHTDPMTKYSAVPTRNRVFNVASGP